SRENIPVGARILRVCDVYSALVSDRHYRKAYDKDTAIELMIEEVKNFDMRIFLGFMELIHSDEFFEMEQLGEQIKEQEEQYRAKTGKDNEQGGKRLSARFA
ncbi:MAG: phosphohydrolase, partial [Lachnospiraceae bacterium]|nr:phosphohydrolase [Lachnospiraceae bacterium]